MRPLIPIVAVVAGLLASGQAALEYEIPVLIAGAGLVPVSVALYCRIP